MIGGNIFLSLICLFLFWIILLSLRNFRVVYVLMGLLNIVFVGASLIVDETNRPIYLRVRACMTAKTKKTSL